MLHNIFAHTEPTPPEGYPAYVSINRDEHGTHNKNLAKKKALPPR